MFVSGGDFDQNVLGVESNLGVIRVDDGRKRTDSTLGIENNGVDGRVANDVKELAEMLILLQNQLLLSAILSSYNPHVDHSQQLTAYISINSLPSTSFSLFKGTNLMSL